MAPLSLSALLISFGVTSFGVTTLVTVILVFVTDWLLRASSSLIALRRAGIPILTIGSNTLLSFFRRDTLEFFTSLLVDLKNESHGSEFAIGMTGWLTPVGKAFLVVHDDKVLEQIIVTNQSKLTKFHAFGLLEYFRKTVLQHDDAWKVVHRIASKFPVKDADFQAALQRMLACYLDKIESKAQQGSTFDFAAFTRDFYWELVIFLVCGENQSSHGFWDPQLVTLYKEAWIACIAALGSPLGHMFSFFMQLPLPVVWRYKSLAQKLRQEMRKKICAVSADPKICSHWCVLSVIRNEMSEKDQLEVAMEFLFTGASSVTTSLLWLVWHVASSKNNLQQMILEEAVTAATAAESDASISAPDSPTSTLLPISAVPDAADLLDLTKTKALSDLWLRGDGEALNGCRILEATLRETLRMYSPIHIGRLSLEPFEVTAKNGRKVTIPRGTDIFSNMWFVHRDPDIWPNPDHFDHERFLDKPYNVPAYHPFSMGLRACPGQRIAFSILKLIVANLVMKFDMRPAEGYPSPRFDENLMLPVTPMEMMLAFAKRN